MCVAAIKNFYVNLFLNLLLDKINKHSQSLVSVGMACCKSITYIQKHFVIHIGANSIVCHFYKTVLMIIEVVLSALYCTFIL